MKEVLEPLSLLPGVRVVALVTHDGVPVAIPGSDLGPGEMQVDEAAVAYNDGDALSALSVGLLDELARGMGLIAGASPRRVVLKAARGTLIMLPSPAAVLLVVLKAGLNPEELRLPMEGAAARIHRKLRGMGGRYEQSSTLEDVSAPLVNQDQSQPDSRVS